MLHELRRFPGLRFTIKYSDIPTKPIVAIFIIFLFILNSANIYCRDDIKHQNPVMATITNSNFIYTNTL